MNNINIINLNGFRIKIRGDTFQKISLGTFPVGNYTFSGFPDRSDSVAGTIKEYGTLNSILFLIMHHNVSGQIDYALINTCFILR